MFRFNISGAENYGGLASEFSIPNFAKHQEGIKQYGEGYSVHEGVVDQTLVHKSRSKMCKFVTFVCHFLSINYSQFV